MHLALKHPHIFTPQAVTLCVVYALLHNMDKKYLPFPIYMHSLF